MKRHFADVNAGSFFREKKRKQEGYTAIALEKMKAEINPNLLKTVESEKFDNNLKCLISKWTGKHCSMSDCEGTRLVNKFIGHELHHPLTVFIIADDKNKFFEAFNLNQKDVLPASVPELVGFACISGAISIVSELMNDEKTMSECSTELIAYAISSNNRDLALKVAHFFIDKGAKEPGLIYLYCFGKISLAREINSLFTENVSGVKLSLT